MKRLEVLVVRYYDIIKMVDDVKIEKLIDVVFHQNIKIVVQDNGIFKVVMLEL